jgi:hypothetical protein
MSSQLEVKTNADSFLIFDPFSILKIPYNNPWDDASRRQYFFEYFFKSAFFGEFSFSPPLTSLTGTILLLGLIALPLSLLGLLLDLRKRFFLLLPLTVTTVLLLAASIAYRLKFPYAANQDFRFVVLLIIPFSAFAVRGIDLLPKNLRRGAELCLWALALCSAAFVLLAPVLP